MSDRSIAKIAASLIVCLAVLTLAAGCKSFFAATKDKGVNVGASSSGVDINTAPGVDGAMGLRFVFGRVEGTYQSMPANARNAVQLKVVDTSAWYCASIKDRTVALTIMSDSPIAMDLTPLLTGPDSATGTVLPQGAAKVVAGDATKVADTVTEAATSTAESTTTTAQGNYAPKDSTILDKLKEAASNATK